MVLTLCGLDRSSCGALSLVGWDRDRFWVFFFAGLNSSTRDFPQFLMFLGFISYPWAALVTVNALGSCWALETCKAHLVKSSNYRTLGLLHELVL